MPANPKHIDKIDRIPSFPESRPRERPRELQPSRRPQKSRQRRKACGRESGALNHNSTVGGPLMVSRNGLGGLLGGTALLCIFIPAAVFGQEGTSLEGTQAVFALPQKSFLNLYRPKKISPSEARAPKTKWSPFGQGHDHALGPRCVTTLHRKPWRSASFNPCCLFALSRALTGLLLFAPEDATGLEVLSHLQTWYCCCFQIKDQSALEHHVKGTKLD